MTKIPFIEEGVVMDTNDPQQMGRMRIWVPAIDGDNYILENLPWARYISPLAGQTKNFPANDVKADGFVSYGFMMPPKVGALVAVAFLYGDPNRRVFLGSFWRDHGNRSLPQGRHRSDIGPEPLTDTLSPLEPKSSNLKEQFGGDLEAPEAKTRGAYERQVAQGKTDKDGTEGYRPSVVEPTLEDGSANYDPQTYCVTTPGRHSLIFQDNPEDSRMRIVTAAGHQVIFDDANERIYVSTAKGYTYIELDQDGRIHMYAADSISVSSGDTINFTAAKSFNVQAGEDVNIQAGGAMKLAACDSFNASGKGLNLESTEGLNILAASQIVQTGSNIHLNGPKAGPAECPSMPTIVPAHEPWVREASKMARNKNWKQ